MILIKKPHEIEKIKKACKIVAEVFKEIEKEIVPGILTADIDKIAEDLLKQKGAIPAFVGYRGYKHATCLSVNDEVVHGIPGQRQLKEGDIIGVDIGALIDGYYGDAARTFPVGNISKAADKLLRITKKALKAATRQARVGNYIGDISFAVESTAKRYGYEVVKDLFGHGIGRDLHEDPIIPNFGLSKQGPILKPGMVLAIEPMLNIGTWQIDTLQDGWTVVTRDRKLSAHFENTILVTKGDPEVLTQEED